MAERRMFTKKVTDDDNFIALGSSAQALYLHLSMSADDDGFSNQVALSMFRAHASTADLEQLLEKRYIYQFENGVIVIKHWRMSNALRKDRYTPTRFQEELKQLKLKENGAYTTGDGCQMVANWLPDGCPSIGKVSIDNNNINNTSNINNINNNISTIVQIEDDFERDFERFWSIYPKKQDKKTAKSRLKKALKVTNIETIIAAVEKHKLTAQWQKDKGQFIPLPSTWLNEERWNDEVDTSKPKSNNNFNNFDQHAYDIKELTRRAKS